MECVLNNYVISFQNVFTSPLNEYVIAFVAAGACKASSIYATKNTLLASDVISAEVSNMKN